MDGFERGAYDSSGLIALAKSISNLKELNISSNLLKAEGARILAPAIKATGSLVSLTFSGDQRNSKPVTIDTTMTEADFSGAGLGASGAIILAAWLEDKVRKHTE